MVKEQGPVKTGQVNPDRPLVGPSVDTFVGCFVGSPSRAENREISPRGCSRGQTRGATHGPTRGATQNYLAHSWVKFRFRLFCASSTKTFRTRFGSFFFRKQRKSKKARKTRLAPGWVIFVFPVSCYRAENPK